MLMFIDESGVDEKIAPCVVLGGVSISEENLWQFEQAVGLLQREVFGIELSEVGIEIKGKRLLKPKTFRHAAQGAAIEAERRRTLARDFLVKGFQESKTGIPVQRTRDEYTAYGQAAVEFVDRLLGVAALYGVKSFGSIVRKNCPKPSDPNALRKDYNYLFERFFYYLETLPSNQQGLLICDELEHTQSLELIGQISRYFQRSVRGQQRSSRIVPIPFFVHSHLTTAIQLADLVCYIANWSVRIPGMSEQTRAELQTFGQRVLQMQFTAVRADEETGQTYGRFGFCYIEDLRPATERGRR